MAEQGELLPQATAADPLGEINAARREAHMFASPAVQFLFAVMNDREEDTDRRIMAAAEILAFAKIP